MKGNLSVLNKKVNFKNINQLQIELSTYCNASCACCARNVWGGPLVNRFLKHHMQPKTWFALCESQNLQNIDILVLNGNYGDPLMHPMIDTFFEYLIETAPHLEIVIHTNGAIRNIEFWKKFAQQLKKFARHNVHFDLDGIGETHYEYRRVDYDKIIENAKAFIDAGGTADWRMIVFDHNKHQIETASKLAKQYGFTSFSLNRAVQDVFYRAEGTSQDDYEIVKTYTAPGRKEVLKLIQQYAWGPEEVEKSWIDAPCPWLEKGKMQVDPFGRVWPCCYFSLDIFGNLARREYLKDLQGFNDIHKNSLEKILSNSYWTDILPTKWKNKEYSRCNNCQGNTVV